MGEMHKGAGQSFTHKYEDMNELVGFWSNAARPLYRVHTAVDFSVGRYRVKTAETTAEVARALRLRSRAYPRAKGPKSPIGLEVDPFDMDSDHLLVLERGSERLAACFRIRSSDRHSLFACEERFDIGKLKGAPGLTLELSRAYLDPALRSPGPALQMLWRGVSHYAKLVGAQRLIGCTGVKNFEIAGSRRLSSRLRGVGLVNDSFGVQPLKDARVPELSVPDLWDPFQAGENLSHALPMLFQFYLQSGAQILGEPALDRVTRASDHLTLFDLSRLGGLPQEVMAT